MHVKVLALPLFPLLILTEAIVTGLRGSNACAWQGFGGSASNTAI